MPPPAAQAQWAINGANINNMNTGNVGIGVTGPGNKLQIQGGGAGNIDLRVSVRIQTGDASNGGGIWLDNGLSMFLGQNEPNVGFWTSGVGWNALQINKITGNVGIGITTPTQKLHVQGNARVTGDLIVDGNVAAKYQDVAEWVPTSESMSPGTLVVLDPMKDNQVQPSMRSYDTRVAGVVSTHPGLILGEAADNKSAIATTGRVKVMATTANGPIHRGDLLVASDVRGAAMRSTPIDLNGTPIHRPGTVIGKALEPLEKGTGEIMILLTLQ